MRGGDVLSRFVADVDALQDLYLRAIGPPLIAALVVAVVGVGLLIVLPAAAVILVAALLAAGLLVPALASRATAASGRRQAPARADLSAELVEIVRGAPELAVYGREADWAARVAAADARLLRAQRRDAVVGGPDDRPGRPDRGRGARRRRRGRRRRRPRAARSTASCSRARCSSRSARSRRSRRCPTRRSG